MVTYGLITQLLIVVSLSVGSWAATPAPEGVHVFAMTFMDIDLGATDNGYATIYISTNDVSTVRVKVPFTGDTRYMSFSKKTNDYFNFTTANINYAQDPMTDIVENKGAIVVTKDTVSVNGAHTKKGSGEAYLALRLTKESRSYYIPSYPTMVTGRAIFAIAAAGDTCVEMYDIVNDEYLLRKSINLQAGDVYQEYASVVDSDCGNPNATDFTGLHILASKGVSVWSGHECAQLPCGTQFCDHLIEAIPPESAWGSTMVVPGIPGRNPLAGYTLRILAGQNVVVRVSHNADFVQLSPEHGCDCLGTGTPPLTFDLCKQDCTMRKGEFIELMVTDASKPVMVECTPACLVTQYTHSRTYVAMEDQDPDPFMMVITPTDHYVNSMSYVTPAYLEPSNSILMNYVNYMVIVVRSTDRAGVMVDDQPVVGTEVVLGSYTLITIMNILHGVHRIEHTNPAVQIVAFVSGSSPPESAGQRAAARTSYAYPAAYRIDGVTINGNWTLELEPLPGEGLVTTAPKTCSPNEEKSVHEIFTLEVGDVGACGLTQAEVNSLLVELNDAICQSILCPDVTQNAFVKSMTPSVVNNKLLLDVELYTSLDTPMWAFYGCKKHIISYINHLDHWINSLTSAKLSECEDEILDLALSSSVYTC